MRRLLFMLVAATAIMATTACHQFGYKKTKSGLEYKIIHGKNDNKDSLLKAGEFVKFNLQFSVQRKGKPDSVLVSTYGKMPTYTMVDTSARVQLSYVELLSLAKVGDSLQFRVSIDTLKNRGLIDYQGPFTKGGYIVGSMTVLEKFKSEADVNADAQKEFNLEKGREYAAVKAYLAGKKINALQTKDSAFVLVQNPGDPTLKADSGKVASIKYKGYLMENGKVFDTNFDKSKGHDQPIDITIGTHQVIPGWESALPYFGKGGKGQIFVPATLGYGPRGSGEIPANSNLVFDIEVLDVKTAPAPAKKPAMPTPGVPQGK